MLNRKFSTYDIVIVGLMAALCFATTAFLKIGPFPTPAGPTMLKVGNIFCLLAGLLFGGMRGGLAAGIGSALYDLTDPIFVADAPFTLIRFFLMAFICGAIAHWGNADGKNRKLNVTGAIAGSVFSVAFYIIKGIIALVLEGSVLSAAVAASSVKLITSGFNAVFAIVAAVLLAPVCRKALDRAGLGAKLFPAKAAH